MDTRFPVLPVFTLLVSSLYCNVYTSSRRYVVTVVMVLPVITWY